MISFEFSALQRRGILQGIEDTRLTTMDEVVLILPSRMGLRREVELKQALGRLPENVRNDIRVCRVYESEIAVVWKARPPEGFLREVALDGDGGWTILPPDRMPTSEGVGDVELTLGKYKGRTVREVSRNDPDYLRWLIRNVPLGFNVRYNIAACLRMSGVPDSAVSRERPGTPRREPLAQVLERLEVPEVKGLFKPPTLSDVEQAKEADRDRRDSLPFI